MTVVSSKEFVSNQKKYFDLAVSEEVFIKRGRNTFHLICTNVDKSIDKVVYHEPDEDLRRAITMAELRERTYEIIDKIFANK